MKIFTIVVIYNGLKNNWIKKCFDSVMESTIPTEIIAIDNNSSDNSRKFIKENYPNVYLIENNKNKGFGGANNQGLELALKLGGDYFFLLNQDATVECDTINTLIKCSEQNTDYFILSPIHRNGDGKKLDLSFSKSIAPHLCKDFYSDFVLNSKRKAIYETGFICAAAWLLTKRCLKNVGGFSPTFFHYGEDDNYCDRVLYKKGKIGLVPDTYINHDREFREKSHFDEDIESTKRQLTIWASNPLKKESVNKLLKQYRIKKIKYFLLFDKIEYNKARSIYMYLSKISETLDDNYKTSITSSDYIFLKC